MDRLTRVDLDDDRFRDPGVVGPDLAALAEVRHLTRVPETVALVAPLSRWLAVLGVPQGPRPRALLTRSAAAPVSLRCTAVLPGRRPVARSPVLHNLPAGALPEAVIELLAWTRRAVKGTPGVRAVLTAQRFLPARASVLVSVDGTAGRQRVRACWGMAEPLAEPLYFDEVTLADGTVQGEYTVARKETASAPCAGGTRTVAVPAELRDAPVLPLPTVTRIGAVARAAGRRLGPAELEFVVLHGQAHMVRCEPREPHRALQVASS